MESQTNSIKATKRKKYRVGRVENGSKIMADTVVLAAGRKADSALTQSLKDTVREIYAIGDCVQPRMIIDAIEEGAAVGHKM